VVPFTGWKQLMPVYFYVALDVCLIALNRSQRFSWLQNSLLFVLGVFSWMLIEYGLHRFIFHYRARSEFGKKILYAAHLAHHDDPYAKDRLVASLVLSLPVATAYFVLVLLVTRSLHAASYLFTGLTAGYFCYEWFHFQAHHGRSRLRALKYLRTYHLLHHHKTPELRFGVTSPLLDVLFGTFQPQRPRHDRSFDSLNRSE
jgi:sterol desaturase/sphingolipid hydroxylase (fatty acid hydroxylase superfamily)